MSTSIKTLPGSKRAFSLKIEEADMEKYQKVVLQKLGQNISVKGFRKGHVPENILIGHIGPQRLTIETINHVLDKKYRAFINDHKISPISQPKVDIDDVQKMPIEAHVEVEVFPEVTLGEYKKIKIEKPQIEVKDKEVDEVIEHFLVQSGISKPVERAAKKGDLVEIDFAGKDEKGDTLPGTEGKNVKVQLGAGQFLADLEKGVEGMKPGEEKKDVKVKFPKDYTAKDFAGKTIPFELKLHFVGEVDVKHLDESMIEQATGQKKTVENFRKEVSESIQKRKEEDEKHKIIQKYENDLIKIVDTDIPDSWLEKEVETRMERLKASHEFRHDPAHFWKHIGTDEAGVKKEFKTDAEKDLKVFLGLSQIIKNEDIDLDKDELKKAEKIAKKAEKQNNNYEDELLKAKLNLKIDKYLNGLML